MHQQWHAVDGLPQETVLALAQSSDGYLWIGTQDGLARYDGTRFTVFHPRNSSLGNRQVYALVAGAPGEVWVGTSGGLFLYRRGTFEAAGGLEGTPAWIVRCLLTRRDGSLLVGTSTGLFRLKATAVEAIPVAADAGAGEQGAGIQTMAEGPTGDLVVTTADGVFMLNGSTLVRRVPLPTAGEWLAASYTTDGALWLGGIAGLRRFHDGHIATVEIPRAMGGDVQALYTDAHRSLWVATERGLGRVLQGRTTVDVVATSDVARRRRAGRGFAQRGMQRWIHGSCHTCQRRPAVVRHDAGIRDRRPARCDGGACRTRGR